MHLLLATAATLIATPGAAHLIFVFLQFQQDLTYPEIAEALGISVNAVRIRIFRALAALRKELS